MDTFYSKCDYLSKTDYNQGGEQMSTSNKNTDICNQESSKNSVSVYADTNLELKTSDSETTEITKSSSKINNSVSDNIYKKIIYCNYSFKHSFRNCTCCIDCICCFIFHKTKQ